MSVSERPHVSILTPVYNGETYLKECIESVLVQTYSNWDYTIVNNLSTDGTLRIAEEYARKDPRIRVVTNADFLPVIANHNRAFGLIRPDSKYCKVVSADDLIFPSALEEMVKLAEAHPTVGIVGAYQLSGGGEGTWYVRNSGLPFYRTFVDGRDVCHAHLLEPSLIDVFGNPTSVLYRADLVRSTERFYPNDTSEADRSACFLHLMNSDFGFVHQVLSFERIHSERITEVSTALNARLSSKLRDCIAYGKYYLTPQEFKETVTAILEKHYDYLAGYAVSKYSDKAFWDYNKKVLTELGYPLNKVKLSRVISARVMNVLLNPLYAYRVLKNRLRSA